MLLLCEAVQVVEAAGTDEKAMPTFSMVAYTGGPMQVAGWKFPVVVDLAGMSIPTQRRPIRFSHRADAGVGHTEKIEVVSGEAGAQLHAAGVISRDTDIAREVVISGKRGFPWQASIGATATQHEFIKDKQEVAVNGRTFAGPINVIRKSVLGEISFVDLGADDNTSASIAANRKEADMADETKETPQPAPVQAAAQPEPVKAERHVDLEQTLAAARIELDRTNQIKSITAEVVTRQPVSVEAMSNLSKLALEAKWPVVQFKLEVERLLRNLPPLGPGGGDDSPAINGGKVIEAALCLAAGLESPEDHFDEQTLDIAAKKYRHGMGLKELLLTFAQRNGYRSLNSNDPSALLRFAFGEQNRIEAAGLSTFSLPGILSNTANKFLKAGFDAVESTWRSIAATRPVRDFKQITSYSLTGGFQYEEVGPGGELKHGGVGETSYTNQAKTYGRMFAIDRTAIINDDLGALSALPRRIGRGAALKLNEVFWTAFLNNGSFFTTNRGNYAEGTATALSIDSLTAAELLFLNQTDPDGKPLGTMPVIALVPNALNTPISQLMNSTEIRDTTSSTKYPVSNPHAGKYRIVRSSYLSNASISGSSAKAWYLLADPNDLPVIEVAFLNGVDSPTVESADADFNILGVQMRGYFDFGVSLQEYRGGVKLKGEN
jgi:phage major head subunit gpT-like protein